MDTRPESATPTFDNLKLTELVTPETLHEDKPLGKKKKITVDECDAPKKKMKREEEVLEVPKEEIQEGKIIFWISMTTIGRG
jgi:hypothetical protein